MNPEPQQQTIQVVGEIHLVLLPNGRVAVAKANLPGDPRTTALMMCEEGKHQLLDQIAKKKQSPGIAIAPSGLRFPN